MTLHYGRNYEPAIEVEDTIHDILEELRRTPISLTIKASSPTDAKQQINAIQTLLAPKIQKHIEELLNGIAVNYDISSIRKVPKPKDI